MLRLLLIFVFLLGFSLVSSSNKGRPCPVYGTDEIGTCALVINCPDLVPSVKKGEPTVRCGFEGKFEVICCPNSTIQEFPSESENEPIVRELPDPELRISHKKCVEYTAAVFRPAAKVTPPSNDTLVVQVDRCGFNQDLPVKSGEAVLNEFPHMAYIGTVLNETAVRWECLGTLLSETFVLVAASCVTGRSAGAKAVRLGVTTVLESIEQLEYTDHYVKNILAHGETPGKKSCHDIALIELYDHISFNEHIRPACLPRTGGKTKQGIFVRSQLDNNTEPDFGRVLKEPLQDYSYEKCSEEGAELCRNILVGALYEYHASQYCMYHVVGITPYIAHCAVDVYPVFTRIFRYIDWIEDIVWK